MLVTQNVNPLEKKAPSPARTLYFVIPIRHPNTVKDQQPQQVCLAQLFSSLANQSSNNWRAIVVANESQTFPPLPKNVTVVPVDIAPKSHETSAISKEEMFQAIRTDKGSRIAAAMPFVDDKSQVMIVDDDDLLHRDLVSFVTSHSADQFWYIDQGYFWESGLSRVGKMDGLYKFCGTSLILPKTAYAMFSQPDLGEEYAISELGSHKLIFERHSIESTWQPIPYRAAIYRVQHTNSSLTKFAAETRISITSGSIISRLRGFARGVRRGLRGDPRGGMGLYPLTQKLKNIYFGQHK